MKSILLDLPTPKARVTWHVREEKIKYNINLKWQQELNCGISPCFLWKFILIDGKLRCQFTKRCATLHERDKLSVFTNFQFCDEESYLVDLAFGSLIFLFIVTWLLCCFSQEISGNEIGFIFFFKRSLSGSSPVFRFAQERSNFRLVFELLITWRLKMEAHRQHGP